MNKNIIISITISFIIILFAMYAIGGKSNITNTGNVDEKKQYAESVQNVYVKDGIQYVIVNARGGYYPRNSTIKPGIPTKLIIKTSNTYDCSSALSIPSLGVRKMLTATGEEIIDIGLPESGKTIDGTCSMGMYNFKIKVE